MAGPKYLLNPMVGVGGHLATRPFRLLLIVSKSTVDQLYPKQGVGFQYEKVVGNTVHIDISDYATSVSWGASEQDYYTNLRMTLNNFNGVFNRIPLGSKVQLQLRSPFYPSMNRKNPASSWKPYLDVYWFEKSRSADGSDRQMEVTLYDRLYWLNEFPVHALYKADNKKKKLGWTATEIIKHICSKYKIPLGVIPKTKFKIKRIEKKTTLIQFIRLVLAADKKGSGRKSGFTIDMLNGKLNIRPEVLIPKTAYYLEEEQMLESGSLREALEKDKFATRIIITAKQVSFKKDSRGKPVRVLKQVRVVANASKAVQNMYGIRPKAISLKGTHTLASIKRQAKFQLAQATLPTQEFSVNTRGIPGVWPGNKVFIQSRYFGIRGLLKVTSVQYEATSTTLSMALGFKTDTKTVMTAQEAKAFALSEEVKY